MLTSKFATVTLLSFLAFTSAQQQNFDERTQLLDFLSHLDTNSLPLIQKDTKLSTEEFVDYLNKNSGWEATTYKEFEGLTDEEFKSRYLGAELIDLTDLPEETIPIERPDIKDIPTHFNSSEKWPGCVHPIRNQEKCGSCWAFSAAETLSDRFCIASNNTIDVVLSPQYLISCDNIVDHGCKGGHTLKVWDFMQDTGLLTDSCVPYVSGNGTNPLECESINKCEDGAELKLYPAKNGSAVIMRGISLIKENIMKYGPVQTAFIVYADFKQYKGGIYRHVAGAQLGGHAVKIIGWGREDETDYWIIANSWTEKWGENGYFRIAFGECGIDKAAIAGQADLERAKQSRLPSWY